MNRQRPKFGELLKTLREQRDISLTELSRRCGIDLGNLSRIQTGERKPPELPHLLKIATALELAQDSPEWRELFKAAARNRFENLTVEGITYLGYENTLHGVPAKPQPRRTMSLTEAVLQIGKVSATRGLRRITVEADDGSEYFYYIDEKGAERSKGKQKE